MNIFLPELLQVCESLAVKYPILHDRGRQGHDATDSGGNVYSRVVKYKIMPSTNPQDQHETDYYLKVDLAMVICDCGQS